MADGKNKVARKLRRLPDNYHVEKRPLHHPAIPSPNSSQPKIVYVSTKSPFMSTVKRVESLLDIAEKRELSQFKLQGEVGDKKLLKAIGKKRRKRHEITLKATGKAIARGLELAVFFQQKPHLRVLLKTGCVGTVDDIVKNESLDDLVADPDAMADNTAQEDDADIPESRIRQLPVLEVIVRLK